MTLLNSSLTAEGSKDFVNYPGLRLFLDTREPQQLKVFARAGEFINVGSSHVGIQNGFIQVFRPDGQLVVTFDNTGVTAGKAIINNNVQEISGPTGGGTTQGPGYIPGVVQVQAGQEGIWTVVFDYPGYVNTGFANIKNSDPWTRIPNQPNSMRVVLAWDVTVSSGGAGNDGGSVHEGRLFTNEYVSIINGNNNLTSPTFYVLTQDGYLYQVDINNADPFRFPISSNSLGLVSADGTPVYKSKPESAFTRDDDPDFWIPGNIYLYEPQARDFGPLINNKIFFNLPDNAMPEQALVTDVFRNDVHSTWLFNPLESFELSQFGFAGANPGGPPCAPGTMSFGNGGWFILETNLGGNVTLELDLNNNGSYNDPFDRTILANLDEGLDSIFWDGKDGAGIPLGLQDSLPVRLKGTIRYGELHIALTDVENNPGGVTFKWLNALPSQADSLFYYDHTDVGGPVSFPSGGTPVPGVPQPTTVPYTYTMGAGNDKYLDQWFFIEEKIDDDTIFISIVVDCVCKTATPNLEAVGTNALPCLGYDLLAGVSNSLPGIPADSITYSWSGPNGQFSSGTAGVSDTSFYLFSPLAPSDEGLWQVVGATAAGCTDTLVLEIDPNPVPLAVLVTGDGTYCSGADAVLSAVNVTPGIDSISFTWTGPSFFQAGIVAGGDTISFPIPGLSAQNSGDYQLSFTSDRGCAAELLNSQLLVNETPQLQPLTGSGTYCENGSATFSAVNTATGVGNLVCTWSGPNFFSATQNVGPSDTVSLSLTNINPSFQGAYTVTCSSLGCPSAPVSFNLQVDALPQISSITPAVSACPGQPVLLSAQNSAQGTTAITYTWTGPNPSNALLPFTATAANAQGPFSLTIPTLTDADAGEYCLTLQTATGCKSLPQCTNVGIYPVPDIQVLTGPGACIGGDIGLSAVNSVPGVAPVTYIWTSPSGGVVASGVGPGPGPFEAVVPSASIADAGTYSLTLTSGDGCVATASVDIVVTPGIAIGNITGGGLYCEGADVTLSAANTLGTDSLVYQWTGPGGAVYGPFNVGAGDPLLLFIQNLGPAQAGSYQLSVISAGGCTTDPAAASVNLYPDIQAVDIFQGADFCEGQVGTACASSLQPLLGSFTYFFSLPGGSVQSTAGNSGDTVCVDVAAEGTTCVWLETPQGCFSDTACTDIQGLPYPEPSAQPAAISLCEGEDLLLNGGNAAAGSGPVTFTWLGPAGNVIATGTAPWAGPFPAQVPDVTASQAGAYSLVLSSHSCASGPATVNVAVNQAPEITNAAGGGSFCDGATATLSFTVDPSGAAAANWQVNGPAGFSQSGSTSAVAAYSFDVEASSQSAGTYQVTAVSDQGCEAGPVTITIQSEQLPPPSFSASTNLLCLSSELLLTAGTISGSDVSYSWYFEGGLLGTTTDSVFMVVEPMGGSYQVVVNVDGCEAGSSEVDVSQLPPPLAQDDLFEPGEVAPFDDNLLANDQPQGAVTIEITGPAAFGSVQVSDNGNFTYTPGSNLVVSDEFAYEICQVECPGQCDLATVSILFDVECIVPNVVTPNGDGTNDELVILCLENGDFPNNRFRVFNRWGSEVIIFDPYLNDWDITYDTDKKPVPAGVYFFMLELDKNNPQDVITGYVKVVR